MPDDQINLPSFPEDSEKGLIHNDHLKNTTVHDFLWQGVTVTVQDRQTKQPKALIDHVDGIVHAGRLSTISPAEG
jgi:hypothetical protein